MRSGILRCYIQTLKLRADAPFPSQMRWRRLRWLRLRLAALDGCSRDYRAAGAVDPECYTHLTKLRNLPGALGVAGQCF